MVNPLEIRDWNHRVGTLPGATVFHTREWLDVLHRTYQVEPAFHAIGSGGVLNALLPLAGIGGWLTGRKGVGLPFSDLCPPLGDPLHHQRLWEAAQEAARVRGWKYIETRGAPVDFLPGGPSISYLGHVLRLGGTEHEIFGALKGSMRTAIRKAEKSGVRVEIETELPAVVRYYDLHCLTRRRHGLPPQPWSFFQNLGHQLIASDRGFVVTAWKDGITIAADIFVHSFGHAVYKFGASDERYQEFRGSTLAMWHGILRCQQLGCGRLHMGRTAAANEGLQRFKLGFGAQEEPVHYFRLNLEHSSVDKITDRSEGPINNLFRHVPTWAARRVGELLYRHMS